MVSLTSFEPVPDFLYDVKQEKLSLMVIGVHTRKIGYFPRFITGLLF